MVVTKVQNYYGESKKIYLFLFSGGENSGKNYRSNR